MMAGMYRKIWVSLLAPLIGVGGALACSTPVFQYALERWEPESYELVVFQKDPLSPEQQLAASMLTNPPAISNAEWSINLISETITVVGEMSEPARKLYERAAPPSLPWMTVFAPYQERGANVVIPEVYWSVPVEQGVAQRIVDSPARREIAHRILYGDSIVWVLLESGDATKDDAAAACLTNQFSDIKKTLESAANQATNEAPSVDSTTAVPGAPPLNVQFSMLRVSRRTADDDMFVSMLMRMDKDLAAKISEPMAFPVFGRGRVLPPLVGNGINPAGLLSVSQYLTGSCSCEIKSQNPGMDILMIGKWSAFNRGYGGYSRPPVLLTSALETPPPAPPEPTQSVMSVVSNTTPVVPDRQPAGRGVLIRNVLIASVVLVMVVVLSGVVLNRNRRKF